jgi:hypothetical protein
VYDRINQIKHGVKIMTTVNLLPLKKLELTFKPNYKPQVVSDVHKWALDQLADPDLWDYREQYKLPRSEQKKSQAMGLKLIDYIRADKTTIEIIEYIRNQAIEEISAYGICYLTQDWDQDFWHDSTLYPINKIKLTIDVSPDLTSVRIEMLIDYNGPSGWDILFVPKNN